MYKRFRHILMLIILVTGAFQAFAAIALPDTVCVGTDRKYWVTGSAGSIYTWKINGVLQTSSNDFMDHTWSAVGSYTIEVQEFLESCSGDIQTILVTVVGLPKLAIQVDLFACETLTLPAISGVNLSGNEAFYDNTQALGGTLITGPITESQTVWIYDETGTKPNCWDEISFYVTIYKTPELDTPDEVTACDLFTLPAINGVNMSGNQAYFNNSQDLGGTLITGPITATQTVWIYDRGMLPGCSDETSFKVNIYRTPKLDTPLPVIACDSYLLPTISGTNLSGNEAYYDNSQDQGGKKIIGSITASQRVWIYDETKSTPNCPDETFFDVTIYYTPEVDTPSDTIVCDSYELPSVFKGNNLSGNVAWYNDSQAAGGTKISGAITSSRTIWVYDENPAHPACSFEDSFVVTINFTPEIDNPGDQLACDSYTLPEITGVNTTPFKAYYNKSQAMGGTKIFGSIDSTQTVWIYDFAGPKGECNDEESFVVSIYKTPILDNPIDVEVCGSYVLPAIAGQNLSGNQAYYNDSKANGGTVITGPITSSMPVWIFDSSNVAIGCSDETSFFVKINITPELNHPNDTIVCDSFTLPEIKGKNLTINKAYYDNNQAKGGQKITGPITTTQTVWLYDHTGSDPDCWDEDSMKVEIYYTPEIDEPVDIVACDSYELPTISGNKLSGNEAYYDNSQALFGKPISGPITSSRVVWIYDASGPNAECVDEKSFNVTINYTPVIDNPGDLVICDGYELPLITGLHLTGNEAYYDNSQALGGKKISGVLTNSQTVWIYDETGSSPNCSNETSFVLTIPKRPILFKPDNQLACDSYTLPVITGVNLSGMEAYYDNSQTLGGKKITGPITSSQRVWIYDYAGPNGECNDEANFEVTIYPTPKIDVMQDVEACGIYQLPNITGQNLSGNQAYYNDSQANGGTVITGSITSSMKVWIFDSSNPTLGCSDETSFGVKIYITPEIETPNDTIVCDSYTLPKIKGQNLTVNQAYYDNSQALGGQKITGPITTSRTIWIYDHTGSNPDCWDETSFKVDIYYTPEIAQPNDTIVCDSFVLPEIKGNKLSGNEAYYDNRQSLGGQKITGTTISTSQVVWIYGTSGPNAECHDETNFNVKIHYTPEITNPGPIVACDSYELPKIEGKNLTPLAAYYDKDPDLGGTVISGILTESQTVWIFDETDTSPNCSAKVSFQVTIPKKPILFRPDNIIVCDSYTLPLITGVNTTGNAAYYSDSKASGGTKITGPITSTQRVWIYDYSGPNGECFDEANFEVTIYKKPKLDTPADVIACSSYTLPAITGQNLSSNAGYYTNSQALGGTKITLPITTSQRVWIYDNAEPSLVCGDETSFMVNINPTASNITATVDHTPLKCFGKAEGTIMVTNATGGSGVYEYSINGTIWNSTGLFTNLSAGSYPVRVRDANATGCFVTASTVFIAEPQLLTAAVSSGNETFPGAADGNILISDPRGGSGTFEFSINNGVNWQTPLQFTGLVPGKYDVLMRDANATACFVNLKTVDILVGASITAKVSSTDINCFGGSEGSLIISDATGGTGSYEYSIDGEITWNTSGVFENLKAGDYSVSVRDAVNKDNKATIGIHHIDEPGILSATVGFTNETYANAGNGTITLSAPLGGSGNFEFSIDGLNWQSSGNFNNLQPKIYDLFIRDATNILCFIQLNPLEILSGEAIKAEVATTSVTCFDGNDGTLTIGKSTGGSGTYEYSIDGGATWQISGIYTAMKAGSYAVMIRDAATTANLSSLGNSTVDQAIKLDASVLVDNETYPGANNGKIAISNPVGGSGTYEYSINGTVWQATGSFINLLPDSYDVFMRDASIKTCAVLLQKVNVNTGVALTATVTPADALCFGTGTGSITFSNPSGGSGNYQFSINGGATWNDKLIYSNLTAGGYNLMIRDKDIPVNSNSLGKTTIGQPTNLIVTLTQGAAITITGGRTSLSATVSGGSGGYTYLWNDPLTQTTATAINLRAGFYKLVVTDSNGCKSSEMPWEITEPKAFPVVAEIIEPIFCPGGMATIRVSASGATGPFIGIGDFKVPVGTYQYSVTDQASGNVSPSNFIEVKDAIPMSATVEFTDMTCNNANDGQIVISDAKGGSGIYEYRVNGGPFIRLAANPTILNNSTAGVYTIELRDASFIENCIVPIGKITITNPPLISMTAVGTNGKCHGEPGILSFELVNVPDGSYSIVYDAGKFDNVIVSGKKAVVSTIAGIYKNLKVIVDKCSSGNGVDVVLTDPVEITLSAIATDSKCYGVNGTISFTTLNVPNGSYSIQYDSGKFDNVSVLNNAAIVSAPAGIYNNLKITAGVCTSADVVKVTITEPAAMTLTAQKTDSKCFGVAGSIQFNFSNVSDGSYTIVYDGGQFDAVPVSGNKALVSALAKTYNNLKVVDINGCSSPAGVNIILSQPPALVSPVASVTVQPNCTTLTGTILVTVPLGISYEYSLNGTTYQASTLFEGLVPGNYSVKVREIGATCETALATILTVNPAPAPPSVPVAGTTFQPNCIVQTGTITVTVPLGAAYTYSLNGKAYQASPVFTGLAPGDYSLTVKGTGLGCETTAPTMLIVNPVPAPPAVPVTSIAQPTCFLSTGTIEVTSPVGAAFVYSLNGKAYQASPVFSGLIPGNYGLKVKETVTLCETSAAAVLKVNPVPAIPNALVRIKNLVECATFPIQTLNANAAIAPVNGITNIWYDVAVGGTEIASPTLNSIGTRTLYAEASNGVCRSLTRTPVTMTIQPTPEVPVSTGNLIACQTIPAVTLNANTAIVPQSGITITWYDRLTGGNKVAIPTISTVTARTYYAEASNSLCTNPTRTPVTLTIYAIPAAPIAGVTVHPTCNEPNGTVVVTSPVGASYEYSINGGAYQVSATFTGLTWGQHLVRVKHSISGCESTTSTKVTVNAIPPAPVLTAVAEASTCFGEPGSISFTATNAKNGVYVISYDGGEFTNVSLIGGKAKVAALAGTYNNLTIDANGCTSGEIVSVTVTQSDEIVITESITEIDLKSNRKGSIAVKVQGGNGTYSFKWDSGETTDSIKNLDEGIYTVLVTDKFGCEVKKSITIPVPNFPPVAVADSFSSSCNLITGSLILNDSDPENDAYFIDVVPIVNPLHGTVTLFADGTFEYLANPQFDGTDSLQYAIYDENHYQGDTATVLIHIVLDTDHDGITNATDLDTDGDGILNSHEGALDMDNDGDGLTNYLDIDSDGDGILDNIEAQSTRGFIFPRNIDSNKNGIDDAYDKTQGGTEIIPVDADGDGIPDFLDTDADGDGVSDYIEGHDSNGDGRPDIFAVVIDSDADGLDNAYDTFVKVCTPSENAFMSSAPLQDFDGDGIKDWRDDDDDNDKILTIWEDLNGDGIFSNDDIDFDGSPEYLDFGRDCDLLIPEAFSPNGDNIHDFFQVYCIDHFPDARMYIFDQLGNKLFEKSNYGNLDVWKTHEKAWWSGKPEVGTANARNAMVPPGTYYYILDLGNGEVKKSFVFVSY